MRSLGSEAKCKACQRERDVYTLTKLPFSPAASCCACVCVICVCVYVCIYVCPVFPLGLRAALAPCSASLYNLMDEAEASDNSS